MGSTVLATSIAQRERSSFSPSSPGPSNLKTNCILLQIDNLDEDLSDGLVFKKLLEKLSGTPVAMPTGDFVQASGR